MQLEAVIKRMLGMRNDSNSINKSGFANRHINAIDAVCPGVHISQVVGFY